MKRLITALTLFAAPAFAGERLLITDVRLAEDLEAPRVSLLLEHGRITFIRTERNVSIPGVRSYSGEGRWITPAFIDAWTSSGVNAPEIVTDRDRKPDVSAEIMAEMRTANRKGIRAGFSAAETLSFNDDELSGVRKSGFGTLHVAPSGELLGGKSAVISASEAAARDQVIAEGVYQCAAFGASGTGYPSTLMGYHAQLRQFFLDASWNADLSVRLDEGRPGPRPSFDGDLSEGEVILRGERRLLCEAETDDDILRWLRLKDEWQTKGWDVQIAIVGGREAWRVADVLREREIPVILTLNWGDEVKDPDKGKDKDKDRDEEEVEDVTGDAEEMTTEEDVQVEPVEAVVDDAAKRLGHEALAGVGPADPVAEGAGLGDAAAHVRERDTAENRIVLGAENMEAEREIVAPLLRQLAQPPAVAGAAQGIVGPKRLPGLEEGARRGP